MRRAKTMNGEALPGRPTNVLHARVMAGTGGGPEKTILRSPRYADPARYRMTAAYITPTANPGNASLQQRAEALGCPLRFIEERGPVDWRTVRHLSRLCDELNIDIWHGHDYKSNLIGLMLRRMRRRPMKLITTVHLWTDETRRLMLYKRIDKWTLPRYERVIAVSPELEQACRAAGVADDRAVYIPNAIEPECFQRSRTPADARRALGFDARRPTLGFVGRLSNQKRIDKLIDILPAIQRRIGPVQLLLVGDGVEGAKLQNQVGQLGLADTVRFCGWRDDLHRWYEAMDVMMLPSEREGLPNVLLEAMALQVPVAATNVGANDNLLDQGRCGVLLSQQADTWIEPLCGLLTDGAARERLARLGRHRIETEFSFATRMQRIMSEYDRLLGRTEPVARRKAA